jgi:hypothetical protein
MVKSFFITAALILIIALLVIIAVNQQTVVTIPQEPIKIEQPTPRAEEPPLGTPTPREEDVYQELPGVEIEKVYPGEAHFWVNEIKVPEGQSTYNGYNFIPIKEDKLKTYAGTFGPYKEDPTKYIHVVLCAEMYRVNAAPACEIVPITYNDRYVSFAKGYQYDEYIGGLAAKDYSAYYDVYVGDIAVAHSNKAVIRTVKT